MTDADLIYNALLRAERRLDVAISAPTDNRESDLRYPGNLLRAALIATTLVREEIGNGLSGEGR